MAVYSLPKLPQRNSLLDAETIGDYFNKGLNGFVFKLSNGKVLKIVSLFPTWRFSPNVKQSNFIDEYIQNTKSGKWSECKVLPKYYYYNEGYANQQLLDELEDMDSSVAYYFDINYNDKIAMWVTDYYNTIDVPSSSEIQRAERVLNQWGAKNGMTFGDLHNENLGIDENGGIVFFDFTVNMQ